MKKYTTYQNTNGSYTTYEEDVQPGPGAGATSSLLIFILSLPLAPILYFVTKAIIKKKPYHKRIEWLKFANKVYRILFIIQAVILILEILFVSLVLSRLIDIPQLYDMIHEEVLYLFEK